jgi:hypothetical protein
LSAEANLCLTDCGPLDAGGKHGGKRIALFYKRLSLENEPNHHPAVGKPEKTRKLLSLRRPKKNRHSKEL